MIWPEEEESEEELDEDGKPKKKKKKKPKKIEIKMYPKHEYAYPTIGKLQKKQLDSVFNDNEGYNQTLSYFCRPNVTSNSTNFHKTHKERAEARDMIAKKKAQLFGLL